MSAHGNWTRICQAAEVLDGAGVCARVGRRQIAVFRVDDAFFALDNRDPASGANVLSRGIVGDVCGELVVASPLYKHHYALETGRCLEEPASSVATYPIRLANGQVWVDARRTATTDVTPRRGLTTAA